MSDLIERRIIDNSEKDTKMNKQLMSDLISRQDAIDDVKTIFEWHDTVTEDRIIAHLKMLPSAEPEQRWIPVSERLPEFMKLVLTWDGCCVTIEQRLPYIYDDAYGKIESEWWVSDEYIEESNCYPNLRDGAAIAWMPLPEYYGGER